MQAFHENMLADGSKPILRAAHKTHCVQLKLTEGTGEPQSIVIVWMLIHPSTQFDALQALQPLASRSVLIFTVPLSDPGQPARIIENS